MVSSSFAHRVLTVLGAVLITTVIFVIAYVGLFGVGVQNWLHAILEPLLKVYRAHIEAFHTAFLVIGSSISAVTGSLAILKGFYYAEINLPNRLQELIENRSKDHLRRRPDLLAYVKAPFLTDDFLVPSVLADPFSRLMHVFGYSSIRYEARELASSVKIFSDNIEALRARTAEVTDQAVTGHLLRAEYHKALSSKSDQRSSEWREHLERCLGEYKAILKLRPDDLPALEGAFAIMQILDFAVNDRLRLLRKTIRAAQAQDRAVEEARALREIGALDARQNVSTGWDAARGRLLEATEILQALPANNIEAQKELALAQLLYAEVQRKREKFSAARRALNNARNQFALVGDPDGLERVNNEEEQLKRVEKDKEGPDPE